MPIYKYSSADIEHLSQQPRGELSRYQKRLVQDYNHAWTAQELSRATGLSMMQLIRRIDTAGLDSASVRYRRGEGFVGFTPGGSMKRMYIVQTANGQSVYFATPRSIADLLANLGSGDYEPLKDANVFVPTVIRH